MTKGEIKILEDVRQALTLALECANDMSPQEDDTHSEKHSENCRANIVSELEYSLKMLEILEEA